jgi:hypothetical protein
MSKITEITFSEGKTIQEVQFEPRTYHISAKMEVDSTKESVDDAFITLKHIVHKQLEKELPKKPVDITKTDEIPWDNGNFYKN